MPSRPKPFPHVGRRDHKMEVGAEASVWAISYSDLLMVLLAFFVLYFRFGEQEMSSVARDLASAVISQDSPQSGTGAATSKTKVPSKVSQDDAAYQILSQKLGQAGFELQRAAGTEELIVHFPDNFYGIGRYQLTNTQQLKMKEFLGEIVGQKDRLKLVFVGHSDTLAMRSGIHGVVDSNLVLSNLRAARAAEYAILQGFDPRGVSTEGVGEHQRQARSLSIKILPRK